MKAKFFSADDLSQIVMHPWLQSFHYYKETPSTSDLALQIASQHPCETPLLILTEYQSAGRGRGDHQWWSAPGALTFSLLLTLDNNSIARAATGIVSLAVGLAVCEALEKLLPREINLALKWPNDVYLDGRKLCGILVEASPGQHDKLAIGIGLNVNNSLAEAPQEIKHSATALCDSNAPAFSPTDILIALLDQLCLRWKRLQTNPNLQNDWQRFCLLTGRNIQLQVGPRLTTGICQGIDRQGALLLQTEQGLEHFHSGVIVHYE